MNFLAGSPIGIHACRALPHWRKRLSPTTVGAAEETEGAEVQAREPEAPVETEGEAPPGMGVEALEQVRALPETGAWARAPAATGETVEGPPQAAPWAVAGTPGAEQATPRPELPAPGMDPVAYPAPRATAAPLPTDRPMERQPPPPTRRWACRPD